jgi:hypothetical protein
MSAAGPKEPEKWQLIAWAKQDERFLRIPTEWILPFSPSPDARTYLDVPRKCGLLSEHELRITEDYDACGLAEGIRERKLKCVDVARAFCKVC